MSTRFTRDHEWVRLQTDGTAIVGITEYAQQQLGDVVFVDLPQPGRSVSAGKEAAVVESVKAASEVYAPIDGEVVAVNDALPDDPSLVNSDPLGKGWFLQLRPTDAGQIDRLMDEAAYKAYLGDIH